MSIIILMTVSRIFELDRPLIIAHRGGASLAPENTVLALRTAVGLGVDVIETDLQLTKDNQFVLFHDDNLSRMTGREEAVRNLTLEELQQIDITYNLTPDNGSTYPYRGQGHRILTLSEAFEEFSDIIFNMDIKSKEDREAPELLASEITKHERQNSVIVASFHDRQIERFRALMPDVATAACPGEVSRFVFGVKTHSLRLTSRNPKYHAFQVPINYGVISVVNSKFVEAAHERGIAVHVWTINERAVMTELIDLGVDGIITDEPVMLRDLLKEKGLM
jgi:glycerophosphoryl diester phosphodiesterase